MTGSVPVAPCRVRRWKGLDLVSSHRKSRTDYYEGESGEAYQLAVHGQEIQSPAVHRAKALLARRRYFNGLSPSARVFEFGTGAGFNLRFVEASEVAGYDISETARRLTRDQGVHVYDSMSDVPNSHFDLVLCRHVLEHVPDPVAILESVASKIAPDGSLLLILPVEHGRRHQRMIKSDDVNQHLYSWKLQHASNLLGLCGMEVQEFEYRWYSGQRLLGWVLRLFGIRAFDAAVTMAGILRRQSEMVIRAKLSGDDSR